MNNKNQPKKEIRSRKERKKNFNPRKWASKWLSGSPMAPRVSLGDLENSHYWDDAIVCFRCKNTYGGGEKLSDDNTYCYYCLEDARKELNDTNNRT